MRGGCSLSARRGQVGRAGRERNRRRDGRRERVDHPARPVPSRPAAVVRYSARPEDVEQTHRTLARRDRAGQPDASKKPTPACSFRASGYMLRSWWLGRSAASPHKAMFSSSHRLVFFLVLTSVLIAQGRVFELEPQRTSGVNDSPATADPITLGNQIDCDLAFGDQDWFRFTTTGGNIALYLSGDGATAVDARMALFDNKGTTMLA